MRYSLETNYRKYVQGYDFLSFARKFGDKYGKKLMDNSTKTVINTAKKIEDKYDKKLMDTAKNRIRYCKNCFEKSSSKSCRSYWRFNWK